VSYKYKLVWKQVDTSTNEKYKSHSNHEYLKIVQDKLLWIRRKAPKSKHRKNFGGWL